MDKPVENELWTVLSIDDEINTDELEVAMRSLDFTPTQRDGMLKEPERALEWITYARTRTGLTNPGGWIWSKFKSGEIAPDPNAWRGDDEEPKAKGGPDYTATMKSCEALVKNTAHEYPDTDLMEEFERIGKHPRIGNGALLTDDDERRLLDRAQSIRVRHEAASTPNPEFEQGDDGLTPSARRWRLETINRGGDPRKFHGGATDEELAYYKQRYAPPTEEEPDDDIDF